MQLLITCRAELNLHHYLRKQIAFGYVFLALGLLPVAVVVRKPENLRHMLDFECYALRFEKNIISFISQN